MKQCIVKNSHMKDFQCLIGIYLSGSALKLTENSILWRMITVNINTNKIASVIDEPGAVRRDGLQVIIV